MTAPTTVSFRVDGTPKPQGSKSGFSPVGTSHVVQVEAVKGLKPWRARVVAAARSKWDGAAPLDEPVHVWAYFWMPRPKAHYRTGRFTGQLRDDAPTWQTSKPDGDKLLRAVLDALTIAGVLKDDALVCVAEARKLYSSRPGVTVHVGPAGPVHEHLRLAAEVGDQP